MSKEIIIQAAGAGFAVTIPGEALRQKTQALERAASIVQVTNPDEQEAAIQAVAVLKGLSSGAEKTREQVKKPYFQAGKAIDAKAKEYVKEIDERAEAIERQIGAYQAEQRRLQAERERAEENRRKEAEAAAQREQDRIAEIERNRLEAERMAAEAKTPKARAAAAAEAQRLADEQTMAEIDAAEAQDAAAEANAIVVVEDTTRATGATITEIIDFDITDVEAVYAWDLERRTRANNLLRIHLQQPGIDRPFIPVAPLVKLEIRRREFKEFIANLSQAELDAIPGVVFKRETKAAVRSVAPTLALQ